MNTLVYFSLHFPILIISSFWLNTNKQLRNTNNNMLICVSFPAVCSIYMLIYRNTVFRIAVYCGRISATSCLFPEKGSCWKPIMTFKVRVRVNARRSLLAQTYRSRPIFVTPPLWGQFCQSQLTTSEYLMIIEHFSRALCTTWYFPRERRLRKKRVSEQQKQTQQLQQERKHGSE